MSCPYLFQIHTLHRPVHPLDHIRHAPRDRAHGHSSLHARADGVDPRAQAQQVQLLVLLPDCILCVDLRYVGVTLLDCLGWVGGPISVPALSWNDGGCVPEIEIRGQEAYLLQLRSLGLLIFSGLRCLSVELLCGKLDSRAKMCQSICSPHILNRMLPGA